MAAASTLFCTNSYLLQMLNSTYFLVCVYFHDLLLFNNERATTTATMPVEHLAVTSCSPQQQVSPVVGRQDRGRPSGYLPPDALLSTLINRRCLDSTSRLSMSHQPACESRVNSSQLLVCMSGREMPSRPSLCAMLQDAAFPPLTSLPQASFPASSRR